MRHASIVEKHKAKVNCAWN